MMKIDLFKGINLLALAVLSTTWSGADVSCDGGQPMNPKDLKGKKIVLAGVPKLIGIGYFAATARNATRQTTYGH